ncbi:jg6069 [Pararge aegeria aegeria]|uniref:Jg6069 protein n=1 Tax=Pararge aegeria aegeria TaxID=348720 RepID=A0A8S4S830_9NEOP|nr:jg6069 [Pararge aegeria aegeria]
MEEESSELPGGGEGLPPKQRHQAKHRELFLSRHVETLPATHIRGKCTVTLLNETESLLSYLNKDDAFFYCLVFDPSQKTLLADKGEIRVGSRYQTEVTNLLKEDVILGMVGSFGRGYHPASKDVLSHRNRLGLWVKNNCYIISYRMVILYSKAIFNKPNPALINSTPNAANKGAVLNGGTNGTAAVSPSLCASCQVTNSNHWYSWGPQHLQYRLCGSCWQYWKKYGGLKTADVFGESEAEVVRSARAEGEETALSVSHRPHRCTVINCAKEFKLRAHLARHVATAHGGPGEGARPRRAALAELRRPAARRARAVAGHARRADGRGRGAGRRGAGRRGQGGGGRGAAAAGDPGLTGAAPAGRAAPLHHGGVARLSAPLYIAVYRAEAPPRTRDCIFGNRIADDGFCR